MKICWDSLEKLRYSKRTGKWYNGNGSGYIEFDVANAFMKDLGKKA